jgi:RHS repeat-associated protein
VDSEINGNGNAYDFGARMYDSRLGRWWSVDPQFATQADQSVYKSFLNNPILFADPNGETEWITTYITGADGTTVKSMQKVSDKVMTDGKVREVPTTIMGLETGKHLVVDYYDFETINYVRINVSLHSGTSAGWKRGDFQRWGSK